MNQNDQNALTQNWDQAKEQIKSQFGVTDDDVATGQTSPDQLSDVLANQTGQDRNEVEKQLSTIAQSLR
jgi:uncharacterized protein YjbJ (UPF0337 family)